MSHPGVWYNNMNDKIADAQNEFIHVPAQFYLQFSCKFNQWLGFYYNMVDE